MDPYLREELAQFLPPEEVERLARGAEERRRTPAGDLNRGHYFEVLDRVHVAAGQLEAYVGSHPVLARHPELATIYDRAAEALAELYQAAGRLYAEEARP
jgi:hypothetical protein